MLKLKNYNKNKQVHVGSWQLLQISEIVLLEAQGSYTNIYLKSGDKLRVSICLAILEERLSTRKNFYRMSRKCIINIRHMKGPEFHISGNVINYNDKVFITIPRRKTKEFWMVYSGTDPQKLELSKGALSDIIGEG